MQYRYNITNIDKDKHLPQIAEWDLLFWNDERYASTRKYLLDPMLDDYSTEYDINNISSIVASIGSPMVNIVEEYMQAPNDKMLETRRAIVAENKSGKVVGLALTSLVPQNGGKYLLSIDNIATHPFYHGKVVGSAIMSELINSTKQHFGKDISEIVALIEQNNAVSINLFKKFNFSFETQNPSGLLKANLNLKSNASVHE